MKTILFFSLFALMLSCTYRNTTLQNSNESTQNRPDSQKIVIYTPDSSITKVLKDIVENEKKCPYYSSINSCFVIWEKKDSAKVQINITSMRYSAYTWNWDKPAGVFEFDHHYFLIDLPIESTCLFHTVKDSIIYYWKDKFTSEEPSPKINDEESHWILESVDGRVNILYKNICIGDKI